MRLIVILTLILSGAVSFAQIPVQRTVITCEVDAGTNGILIYKLTQSLVTDDMSDTPEASNKSGNPVGFRLSIRSKSNPSDNGTTADGYCFGTGLGTIAGRFITAQHCTLKSSVPGFSESLDCLEI